MKIHRKNYLSIAIMIGLFLTLILIGQLIPEAIIRQIIKDAGYWGPVVLVFLFWVTHVIAPLSGSPFLYAGFYLYGQSVVIYTLLAAIIASVTNYWIARTWGRSVVLKLAGAEGLAKVDGFIAGYGLRALLICRLFLKEFHDMISYAFGLSKLRFWPYFMVSTLGMIPAFGIWYYISFKIGSPLVFTILSWTLVYIPVAGYIIYSKLLKKKI